jgi:asparagine synthase (glutamine-hydrolysing)
MNPEVAPTAELLRRMAAPMARRGPDDEGIFLRGPLGLAHRRLSIIDLAGGHQPILNEDESLALVCNGEIYGFRELRSQLQARGHRFRSQSDSEVILHLYEEKGEACLNELNGMFALAIAHLQSGRIFLARDRFGQKPLFYAQDAGRLAFASGPASLVSLDWVDQTLDPTAIHDYLEYQCIPCPRSIYRGVRKMPPGSYAVWNQGQLRLESFWKPSLKADFCGSYQDAVGELRRCLNQAVSRRLIADVPLGTFLSGGVDSSLISALAVANGKGRLSTFSIGFPEKKYDERQFAQLVATHLQTDHHFLEVNPDNFDSLAEVVGFYEEPFADASMLPTALLSKFTRQYITVALSGDGADELFGGYYRYRVVHLCRLMGILPRGLRSAVKNLLLSILPPKVEERSFWGRIRRLVELGDLENLEQYLQVISRFPESLRRSAYGPEMQQALMDYRGISVLENHYSPAEYAANAIMELDCKTYLPDDILVKVDRASMAYGLEVRSPFLDPELAQLALSLPYGFKQHGRRRKRILEDAFAPLLPPEIFSRPKMGFGLPVANWLRGAWRQPAYDLLLNGKLGQGLFRREALESMLDRHCEQRADYSYPLFALLVLELWLSGCRSTLKPET